MNIQIFEYNTYLQFGNIISTQENHIESVYKKHYKLTLWLNGKSIYYARKNRCLKFSIIIRTSTLNLIFKEKKTQILLYSEINRITKLFLKSLPIQNSLLSIKHMLLIMFQICFIDHFCAEMQKSGLKHRCIPKEMTMRLDVSVLSEDGGFPG